MNEEAEREIWDAIATTETAQDAERRHAAELADEQRRARLETAAAGIRESAASARRMSQSPTIHQTDAYAAEADSLEAHAQRLELEAAELEPDYAELHRQRLEGHTTHRERLERKAEKRHEWSESRTRKADAATASGHARLDVIPFGQPVHGARDANYRAKARRALERGHEHATKAAEHEQKAAGLESQLAGAIYSDDPDAIEQLEAKLARLEQQRETMKQRNATYRKKHRAELRAMGAYDRGQSVPHAPYELQNLAGNITRTRQRLEQLKREAVAVDAGSRGRGRPMLARFSSSCADCAQPIEKGAPIVYYRLTREATHAECPEGDPTP